MGMVVAVLVFEGLWVVCPPCDACFGVNDVVAEQHIDEFKKGCRALFEKLNAPSGRPKGMLCGVTPMHGNPSPHSLT